MCLRATRRSLRSREGHRDHEGLGADDRRTAGLILPSSEAHMSPEFEKRENWQTIRSGTGLSKAESAEDSRTIRTTSMRPRSHVDRAGRRQVMNRLKRHDQNVH